MTGINKSAGLTESERFLAKLADRTFLSLWAYPNVFRGPAKELCDLLVVCGKHVLVFSDKSIDWPFGVDEKLAWSRWYRRAIAKSADQLARAISWIRNHPDRLFLDPRCENRFPIEIPPASELQVHGIIVARGASEACFEHFASGSGSLGLMPVFSRTRNAREVPESQFFIGNPCPNDHDVYHVLDYITLRVLLSELDTVVDLTDYLTKKERLIRGDHLLSAHGEEDLLAIYLKDINHHGEHDFVVEKGKPFTGDQKLVVEGGSYAALRKRGEYKRKKAADRVSYVWDHLVESFARNIISDSSYVVRGYESYHEPSKSELGLRHMALVSRLERRTHALAIKGAFESIGKRDRFFRAMLPGPTYADRSTGFFLLLVKRDTFLVSYSDEEYRMFRANLTYGYAMNLLRHIPYLERVVGIATEGEFKRLLRSEDLIYAERPNWDDKDLAEVDAMAERMEIFKNGAPTDGTVWHIRPHEYPPTHYEQTGGVQVPYAYAPESTSRSNRRQRRAERARSRRAVRQ